MKLVVSCCNLQIILKQINCCRFSFERSSRPPDAISTMLGNAHPPKYSSLIWGVSIAKNPKTWKDYLGCEFLYCNKSCCFPYADKSKLYALGFNFHNNPGLQMQSAQCSPTHQSIPLFLEVSVAERF